MQALRVLIVDDDPNAIHGLYRALALKVTCKDWEVFVAASGEKALDVLNRQPVDVVIADISMPGMQGTDLLRIIHNKMPSVLRVVLSGMVDAQSLVDSKKWAQIALCKPCSAESIRREVEAHKSA